MFVSTLEHLRALQVKELLYFLTWGDLLIFFSLQSFSFENHFPLAKILSASFNVGFLLS